MNLLRNLSSAIRRATSASHMLDRAASNPDLMTRAPTLSSLVNASSSIGTTTSVGATTTVKDNPSALQADTVVTSPVVYSQQSEPVAILKAGQQSANWSNPFVSHALPAILQLSRHLSESSLSQSAMRTQLGLEVRLYRERWPALVVSGKKSATRLICYVPIWTRMPAMPRALGHWCCTTVNAACWSSFTMMPGAARMHFPIWHAG